MGWTLKSGVDVKSLLREIVLRARAQRPFLKEKLNPSKPSKYPPDRGENRQNVWVGT